MNDSKTKKQQNEDLNETPIISKASEPPKNQLQQTHQKQQTETNNDVSNQQTRDIAYDTQKEKKEPPKDKKSPNLEKQIRTHLNLELFITGYLYFDTSGKTFILLEKKEKTPSEVLSYMIRLGNASLEWSENQFVLSYAENQISLPLKELKEVRFLEDCAIFIQKQNNTYYYFFSRQINELKEFMSKLLEIYKSSV